MPALPWSRVFPREMAINISSEDHFRGKLVELVDFGQRWVVRDDGALSLDKDFELI
ncbi:hypothetical protein CRG98_025593 [Punica granatum]|uniref:Uncharacterized protein n=1 Tax=Punica granatum TaxID=22663 RepID=A0A2I0JCM1_PUNGR|nr:hypothetical protein CRG98_025593 [Punica granatum]